MKILLLIVILCVTACSRPKEETHPAPNPKTAQTVPHKEEKTPSEAKAPKDSEAPEPAKKEIAQRKEANPEALPHDEKATKKNISYPIFTAKKPSVENAEKPAKSLEGKSPDQAAELSDPVNQLVAVYVDELDSTYNSPNSNIKADFSIMHKDDRYASILFTGKLDGADYVQDFITTLNIDLQSGCRTQLNQIVLIDSDFIDIVYDLLQDKIIGMGGDMNTLYPRGIEDIVYEADWNLASPVHSYFTPSQITLIFSLPHELGDYATVSVPNKIDAVFD